MEFLSPGVAALLESNPDPVLQQFVGWLDQTQTPYYAALEDAARSIGHADPDFKGLGYSQEVFTGEGMCTISTTHQLFAARLKFPQQLEARAIKTIVSYQRHYLSEFKIGPNPLLLDGVLGQYNDAFIKKYLLCLSNEARNYYQTTTIDDAEGNLAKESWGVAETYHRHLTGRHSFDQIEQGQLKILCALGVIEDVTWKARLARDPRWQRLHQQARIALRSLVLPNLNSENRDELGR